jgi:hypothetical protein
LRAASKAYASVIQDEPGNVYAIAGKARVDARIKRISIEQARSEIEQLIATTPGEPYLEVSLVVLNTDPRQRTDVIVGLREIAAAHPADSYANQVLAGLLGCDRSTWTDAWEHWKIALNQGPLLTPGYKSAAYYLARRNDPSMVGAVFQDTGPVERLAIRTRSPGFNRMYLVLGILVALSLALKSVHGDAALSYVAMAVGAAWVGWSAFTNYAVGCWKCFFVWLTMLPVMWLLVLLLNPADARFTVVGLGIAALFMASNYASKSSRQRNTATAR